MADQKMTADEKRWRAENDARVLVDAETIRTEKARLGAALKEITKMNKVKEKEIKLAKKVVGKGKGKKTPTKKTPTKRSKKPTRTTRKTTKRKR